MNVASALLLHQLPFLVCLHIPFFLHSPLLPTATLSPCASVCKYVSKMRSLLLLPYPSSITFCCSYYSTVSFGDKHINHGK